MDAERVSVSEFDAAVASNVANWDQRADVHVRSKMYDVPGFLADSTQISEVVERDHALLGAHLPAATVQGLSLLHLQCHIGIDTVSWARLGAGDVAGLDVSPNSLQYAARIADADGRAIEWIEGDARFASTLTKRRFDVVVTSAGTIVWLPELVTWAQSIYEVLNPGGVFLIRDDHPVLAAMAFQPWQISDDYLSGGGTRTYRDADTYTENSAGQITSSLNHEWRHDLGEVVTVLLDAGLAIEAFAELPFMDWPAFPSLVRGAQGWTLPAGAPRIPLNFAIVARRPSSRPHPASRAARDQQ